MTTILFGPYATATLGDYNINIRTGENYTQGGSYLSGAYAFPNYNANVFFLSLKYTLQ